MSAAGEMGQVTVHLDFDQETEKKLSTCGAVQHSCE
jgi:hypothetical protein